MDYAEYRHLRFDRPSDGVVLVTIDRPDRLNAANDRLHHEFAEVWRTIGRDDAARVAVITGEGRAFSAGGDLTETPDLAEALSESRVRAAGRNALAIVNNMLDLDKPIVSAINGVAVGAGLAVALTADISVIGENVKITDGHARIGVGSGDHAVLMWPWLCGMAKTKYYLLTADFLTGVEAERIGLVSMVVPDSAVVEKAMEVAARLAHGPAQAMAGMKRSLNKVLRLADPAFELSVALESLDFMHPDAAEGMTAFREKRQPTFPSASTPSPL